LDLFLSYLKNTIEGDYLKLDVPVYIFVGRDDVNAMASLVEKYFTQGVDLA
jgi:hypothetical protein